MAKHQVATAEEIPVGGRKLVTIAGRSIGVFNVDGEYFALRNTCPHQGGALCEGKLSGFLTARVPGEYEYSRRGEILRCPWHGWEFDVKTGQSWVDSEKTRVRIYPVSVEVVAGGRVAGGMVSGETAQTDDTTEAAAETTAEVEVGQIDPETGRVAGPYTAETYEVSVEQQMVFIEI